VAAGGGGIVNEDHLRAAYMAAMKSGALDRSTHVSPEAIASLVRGEGPESERLATLDHVMSCIDCRKDFDLLRAVEQAGRLAEATRATPRRAWLVPAALAASLLVAVGLGRMVMKPAPDDVTRGSEADVPTLLRPGAEAVAGDSITFVWSTAPGARKYTIELLDVGGGVVVREETADTTVTTSRTMALPAGDYTWWVRATTTDARTLRSSVRPLRLKAR
jgi:hypothetical protein